MVVCLGELMAEDREKVWILFKQNQIQASQHEFTSKGVSKRALQRRAVRGQYKNDIYDEEINADWIAQIEHAGFQVSTVSRWLKAVSGYGNSSVFAEVSALPFVRQVQPVRKFKKPDIQPATPLLSKQSGESVFDYGLSEGQNQMMAVPAAHAMGLSGKGILIGMLDTGFDYQDRPVFSHLDIAAEYDFIQQDSLTANSSDDYASQHQHGTRMLSAMAGFEEGGLIGPGYGVSVALAKTEQTGAENRVEEDYWVQGLEWLESLGVDIVTSSLGYSEFDDDPPGGGYSYRDIDGNTAVTTIAADIAASKGIVMVNSAGNLGNDPWRYVSAPADGDSVIAVGALSRNNTAASFSSTGPTADGRIKPDVSAPGIGICSIVPSISRESSYDYGSGTSFSCALVAGICGMILEAHPCLTAMEVREALRETADRAENPDTLVGWGLVNAPDAIFYHGLVSRRFKVTTLSDSENYLFEADLFWKNAFQQDSVCMVYRTNAVKSWQRLMMQPAAQEAGAVWQVFLPGDVEVSKLQFYFEIHDSTGRTITGPPQAPVHFWTETHVQYQEYGDEKNRTNKPRIVNYPNPFTQQTRIQCTADCGTLYELNLYNASGQFVKRFKGRAGLSGMIQLVWHGIDKTGQLCGSGIYFGRLNTEKETQVFKLLLIR